MPAPRCLCLICVSLLLVACTAQGLLTTRTPPTGTPAAAAPTGTPTTDVPAAAAPTGTSTAGVPAASPARFKLYVLRQSVDELDLGYTVQTCFPKLKALKLDDPLILLTEADVEVYDWASQVITLTAGASEQFRQLINVPNYVPGLNTFVVTFDDAWKYGGMLSSLGSARGSTYPSIFLPAFSYAGKVPLAIRPDNNYFPGVSPIPALSRVILVPQIHAYFRGLGKLIE